MLVLISIGTTENRGPWIFRCEVIKKRAEWLFYYMWLITMYIILLTIIFSWV
jgi:hypothetical protein